MLCSVLHKMAASPVADVPLVDCQRPYIVLDESEWTWTTLHLPKGVRADRFLNHACMPTRQAGSFLLLRDLYGGADGRVWMVCTTSGLVGVIKFGQPRESEDRAQRGKRLEEEAQVWRDVWQQHDVRVVILAGEPALLMPYVQPIDAVGQRPPETAVREAAACMAKAGYCHLDLDWRHVGFLATPVGRAPKRFPPPARDARVIFFDLGRVRRRVDLTSVSDPADDVAEMLAQLYVHA